MVSLRSVLRTRSALWHDELDSFGYRLADPPTADPRIGVLRIRAMRPRDYGGPAAVIDLTELWREGSDPDGLGLALEGCFLVAGSWHAQLATTGEAGAERLDLDRAKPARLVIHRHPYGFPNAVRMPAAPLIQPVQWLQHLEELIYDTFGADS